MKQQKQNIFLFILLGTLFFFSTQHINQIILYFEQTFPLQRYFDYLAIYTPFIPSFLYPYLTINIIYGLIFLMMIKNQHMNYLHNIIYSLVIQFLLNQIFYLLLYLYQFLPFSLNWQWLEIIIQATEANFIINHIFNFNLPYHQSFIFYASIAVAFFIFYHPNMQKKMLIITFLIWLLLMCWSMLLIYQNAIIDLFMEVGWILL